MINRHSRRIAGRLTLGLLLALLCARSPFIEAAQAADAAAAPAQAAMGNEDGLVRTSIKGVDLVLQRPGTDWASYTRVLLAPVEVSFSKSWNPRDYGTFGLRASDVDRIRRELAQITGEVFARVLGEGGYELAQGPGEGVLQVRPNIVNLYINAPDALDAGRTRTYVLDAGEMTLALELRDSITGTLLAQARDRKQGVDSGRVTLSNSVMNRVEAERALRLWAMQLRRNLDAARRAP